MHKRTLGGRMLIQAIGVFGEPVRLVVRRNSLGVAADCYAECMGFSRVFTTRISSHRYLMCAARAPRFDRRNDEPFLAGCAAELRADCRGLSADSHGLGWAISSTAIVYVAAGFLFCWRDWFSCAAMRPMPGRVGRDGLSGRSRPTIAQPVGLDRA